MVTGKVKGADCEVGLCDTSLRPCMETPLSLSIAFVNRDLQVLIVRSAGLFA